MIPFNRPYLTGNELTYIEQAATVNGHLSGEGPFAKACSAWLQERLGSRRALLTHSCTGALEMAALLAGVSAGDEVILPSFTFVSTANAFALRGATPVFVDVRADTLNVDAPSIEAAITERTRAIVPVHYAGVACDMDPIMDLSRRHGLMVVEDAAQAMLSTYRGRPLGAIGDFAALSFHETKNVISGEGGALLLNNDMDLARAEVLLEKGTNRSQFFRGQVDKYTWVDLGSSFLPTEMVAAFLWAQLEHATAITNRRMAIWRRYHEAFEGLERDGYVRRPIVPDEVGHNAHMYYLLMPDLRTRSVFIDDLRTAGVQAVFHYVPLHSSPMGRAIGRTVGPMTNTDAASERLVRLPLWLGLEAHLDQVIDAVVASATRTSRSRSCRSR